MPTTPSMSVAQLRAGVDAGEIDTVIVAVTDLQGRLQGKRLHARYFLDTVLDDGTEACNYLLAADVEMNTVAGYRISSWEAGYGDLVLEPDLATLCRTPGQPYSATVHCDLSWPEGAALTGPVRQAPRSILRAQLDAAAELGFTALCGTELEFLVFENSFDDAWDRRYQGLRPANRYNVDYSILGGGRVEPLLRTIRNEMAAAGLRVEGAKGECHPGQHEITFVYDEALRTCDNHALYKNGAKEIAAAAGQSLTFMAKYDEREGNSCHLHLSLRGGGGDGGGDGDPVFADPDRPGGRSRLFEHFLAGVLTTLAEFSCFYAPNINSYKRFSVGSFAPTAVAWGTDNRTCALRVVGHGAGLRVENRLPGGDVNPYLAVAAMLAGGLHGIRAELTLPAETTGNAYAADLPRVPATLTQARELLADSTIAREAFGDDVIDHYLNTADVEIAAFDAAVTDWERVRGFERL